MSIALCGAEAAFVERHAAEIGPLMDGASRLAGRDIATLWGAENSRTTDLRLEQLAWYVLGCGIADVLRRSGILPVACAGYSFGVYPALYACGAVDLETGLAVVQKAFDAALPAANRDAGMAAVVGLSRSEVDSILARGEWKTLSVAIENSDTCFVASGVRAELQAFLARALEADAVSARMLGSALPYHHPGFLSQASDDLAGYFSSLRFAQPSCPVVSTIDQRTLSDPQAIAQYISANISSPISWRDTIRTLASRGVRRIVECGPGISLTQNGRFIDADIEYVNIKNIDRKLGV